jgi:hypothetical protein
LLFSHNVCTFGSVGIASRDSSSLSSSTSVCRLGKKRKLRPSCSMLPFKLRIWTWSPYSLYTAEGIFFRSRNAAISVAVAGSKILVDMAAVRRSRLPSALTDSRAFQIHKLARKAERSERVWTKKATYGIADRPEILDDAHGSVAIATNDVYVRVYVP